MDFRKFGFRLMVFGLIFFLICILLYLFGFPSDKDIEYWNKMVVLDKLIGKGDKPLLTSENRTRAGIFSVIGLLIGMIGFIVYSSSQKGEQEDQERKEKEKESGKWEDFKEKLDDLKYRVYSITSDPTERILALFVIGVMVTLLVLYSMNPSANTMIKHVENIRQELGIELDKFTITQSWKVGNREFSDWWIFTIMTVKSPKGEFQFLGIANGVYSLD